MADYESGEYQYAGFWVRAGAAIIDTVLLLVVSSALFFSIYGMDGYFDEYLYAEDWLWFAGPADILISWVLPPVAVILFWVYRQATPGKIAVSARIVDAKTGNKPSVWQCIGRYLAYFPSTLVLGLGLLWIAFDKRKQGWHDKLAGTLVIRNRPAAAAESRAGS